MAKKQTQQNDQASQEQSSEAAEAIGGGAEQSLQGIIALQRAELGDGPAPEAPTVDEAPAPAETPVAAEQPQTPRDAPADEGQSDQADQEDQADQDAQAEQEDQVEQEAQADQAPAPPSSPTPVKAKSSADAGGDPLRQMIAEQQAKRAAQQAVEEPIPDVAAVETVAEESPSPAQADEAPAEQSEEEASPLQAAISEQRAKLKEKLNAENPSGGQDGGGGQDEVGEPAAALAQTAVAAAPAATFTVLGRRIPLLPAMFCLNTLAVLIVAAAVFLSRQTPQSIQASLSEQPGAETSDSAMPPVPQGPESPLVTYGLDVQKQQRAEEAYAAGKFRTALRDYTELYKQADSRPGDALIRDFFAVRLAGCLTQLGDATRARQALHSACDSASPIVRAVANREMALLDARDGMYLSARRRAYKAVAVLGAMDTPRAIEADCEYLIARAATAEAVSLSGAKPVLDWDDVSVSDPFAGKKDVVLRRFLSEGAERLSKAALDPTLRRWVGSDERWLARWSGGAVEEFLHSIVSRSRWDVAWLCRDRDKRRRGITLISARGATRRTLAEVACGAAGLVARFDAERVVVHDPEDPTSTKGRMELLGLEGMRLWRRFFLQAPTDPRVPVGRFARAVLCQSMGRPLDALREYELIANRYWRSSIGAPALLRSARLRMELGDFDGAHEDLTDLLNRYPDSDLIPQAYLSKGRAEMLAGRFAEAAKTFRKLYHTTPSDDCRREAYLGVARCLHRSGDHAEATQWLTRYLGPSGIDRGEQTIEAYSLLGRSAAGAGDYEAAALALRRVLNEGATGRSRTQALMELVDVHLATEQFVQAAGALASLKDESLTAAQKGQCVLLRARTYRGMCLPRRGATVIRNALRSVEDPATRLGLYIELARCQVDIGEDALAKASLTSALAHAAPGPDARTAQCDLAEVSLRMGNAAGAATMAASLLDSPCGAPLRQRAARILGAAYIRQGHYEKAAEVLSALATSKTGDKGDG